MPRTRPIRTTILVLILASGVTSCASLPAGIGSAPYCQVAKPIYWSKDDTRGTKEQADTHNRVWKKLCGAVK